MFRLTSRNFLSADRLHELRHNRSVLVCISNLTTHNLGYRASALVKTHPGNCCVGWVKQPNISDVLVRSELFDQRIAAKLTKKFVIVRNHFDSLLTLPEVSFHPNFVLVDVLDGGLSMYSLH